MDICFRRRRAGYPVGARRSEVSAAVGLLSSAADHQSMRRYRRYGGTLWALAPDFLDYGDVAETMLAIDRDESGGQFASIITRNFKQRAIGAFYAFAHLRGGEHRSHLHSGRILPPMDYL